MIFTAIIIVILHVLVYLYPAIDINKENNEILNEKISSFTVQRQHETKSFPNIYFSIHNCFNNRFLETHSLFQFKILKNVLIGQKCDTFLIHFDTFIKRK